MKKLKSYSSVWKVEQVIYSFGDAKLPTPVTVTQLLWLAASGVLVFAFRKVSPLAFIHNPLILCCIPFGVTWFSDCLCAALESHLYWKACPAKKAPRERGYYRSEE